MEKQWKLALAAYEKALALNPNSTAIFTLIDLYLTAGNQEKAKALYLRAKKSGADPKILRGWSF